MAWKIFNIGKANSEIERLEKEIATLKAAPPAVDATQLADAVASNEQISTQLTQAQTDLTTANQSLSTATANLEKAQGEVNAIGGALKAACTALNLEVKEGATSLEMIPVMQGAVTATLAKLQVDPSKVPAGVPNKQGETAKKAKMTLDEEIAVRKQASATK